MRNTKKLIDTCLITLLIFATGCSVLRSIALFTSFNDKTMHFDGILFTLSAALVFAAALFFLTFLVLAPKKYRLAPDCSSPHIFISSGILAISLLFISFSMFVRAYTSRGTSHSGISVVIQYIPIALALLSILSAAFLFLNIMSSKRMDNLKAALGMCAVIFFALYGIYLYFNKGIHPTNSPNKIIDQMAYFSAAIFFLFETRIALGRDLWKPYIAFGLISALITGYSSIPALIYYFVNGASISDSITETVLTLTLFIYICVKIILTRKLPDDSICKMASAIERMAEAREKELAEHRGTSRAHDYNDNVAENETNPDSNEEASIENSEEPTEGQISFDLDSSTESH